MINYHNTGKENVIAELSDNTFIINETQDVLDLLAMPEIDGCSRFIIREENLAPGFFSLPTGLAGEVLQKISNYRARLAIIGDFSKFTSKNMNDFIRESNRTGRVLFLQSLEEAILRLS